MLDRVTAVWTLDEAEAWWSRWERGASSETRLAESSERAREESSATSAPQPSSPPPAAQSTRTSASSLERTTIFDPGDNGPESA